MIAIDIQADTTNAEFANLEAGLRWLLDEYTKVCLLHQPVEHASCRMLCVCNHATGKGDTALGTQVMHSENMRDNTTHAQTVASSFNKVVMHAAWTHVG